jgi:hypothetical protein
MNLSIHDNQIISYTVNSHKREIHFQTVYKDKEPYEYTDVIFSGVIIYHFECDNFNSIILDIDEVSLEEVYSQYESLFFKLKNYGWLSIDFETKEELIQKMKIENIKAFRINTSYGLDGWIWANCMIKKQRGNG